MHTPKAKLLPKLARYTKTLPRDFARIPAERRERLDQLADFVRKRRAASAPAKLMFICTHNSRRSHLGQLWSEVAAAHYGIDGVETYSGGTEVTAFNPRAVAALVRAGFSADTPSGENPRYHLRYAADRPPAEAFSKRFDDPVNPQADFAAIMTCSHADKSCPFIMGASLRVSIPYEDPKASDDSPQETATYDARTHQIAVEMFYVFSQVARP